MLLLTLACTGAPPTDTAAPDTAVDTADSADSVDSVDSVETADTTDTTDTAETADTHDTSPPLRVLVNELVPRNQGGLALDGDRPDWVELWNGSDEAVTLDRLSLSDSSGALWIGPAATTLDPGAFTLVYADGGEGPDHAPFELSGDGDSLTLTVDGRVADTVTTGAIDPDTAWARFPDGGEWDSTLAPTPGASNGKAPVDSITFEHLPVLLLTTRGGVNSSTPTPGNLIAITDHDGTLTDLDKAPHAYDGPMALKIHGSSSSGHPKHSFEMELRDSTGADLDYPLLGLGSDSDWILYSAYEDQTYVRNAFGYAVTSMLFADHGAWQPRTQFIELYLDGAYQGIYLVVERVKRDGARIDLPAPAATAADGDITGGYVFKIDYGRGPYFATDAGTLVEYTDPRAAEITADQDRYARAYWNRLESRLAEPDFADPTDGYPTLLAVDEWVDHILAQELAHNVDAYRLSTYPVKDPDSLGGLLHPGPVWDLDRAFGNVNYCDCWATSGWIQDDLGTCGYAYEYPMWWPRLLEDPGFQDALACRWEELRADRLTDDALLAMIDGLIAQVTEAEPRDQAVWHTVGAYVGANYYSGPTWESDITWLRDWVIERAHWMDANMWGECR